MQNNLRFALACCVPLVFACNGKVRSLNDASGGMSGDSGSEETGGTPSMGGSSSTGGSEKTGGTPSTGGAQPIGGASATGGSGCLGELTCPWSSRAPLPLPNRSMAVVSYGGRIYSIGGTASDEQASPQDNDRVYVYDPETDEWSARAPLLVGTFVLTAHVVGDKIYAFSGYGPGGEDWFLRDVQVYDPALDRWELKTERPSRRYTFMSEVVANRVVVIGGHGPVGNVQSADEWEPKTDVEVYDVADDTWTTMAPAPDGISSAASCAFNDKIYVFGGEFNNLTSVYDLARDEWTRGTAPPLARAEHSCVRVGDKFLLFGGTGANFRGTPVNLRGTILDRVEQYDPANDTWTSLDPMPGARHWFGATALGNSVYLVGGEDARGPYDSVLRLDFP